MKLAVLVACYNRIRTTLPNLTALTAALDGVADLDYRIFLLDDASPDGTGAAVRAALPDVEIIQGDGSLFWGQGTCAAYDAARRAGSFDAYLLFNDDVAVDAANVRACFDDYREANATTPSLVAGPTWSADRSEVTYGGFRQLSTIWPLKCDRVPPDGSLRPIDMANGNFLLIPGPFLERIGGIDRAYKMGYADLDVSLTALQNGVGVHLARQPIGVCDANPIFNRIANLDLRGRWKFIRRSPLFWLSGYSHFVLKHGRIMLYPAYIVTFFIRRMRILVAPHTLISDSG